jgi:putative spermidine/putrescine transport system ATP-binding protein
VRDGWHHSVLGALRVVTPVADGTGVLVVRQEAVVLTAVDDADADAWGTVVRLRRRGPRALVTVEVGGATGTSAQVTAELGAGQVVPVGREVGLRLPAGELGVIGGDRAADVVESAEDAQR